MYRQRRHFLGMSALTSKADIDGWSFYVRFVL